jgi:hypothetical protein
MNHRHAWLAGACIAFAAIAGWFRPTPLATNAIGAHGAAWRLPTAASLERSSAAQFGATRGVSWVGSGPAGAGTPWLSVMVLSQPWNWACARPPDAACGISASSASASLAASAARCNHTSCPASWRTWM